MKLKINIASILFASILFSSISFSYADKMPSVARTMFTTAVIDREPVDQVLVLKNNTASILFFTDLRHFEGQTITHKWMYAGKTESIVKFKVKGPRWRVYSKIDIKPNKLGKWSVVIENEKGQPVKASVFQLADKTSEQIILKK